MLVGGCICVIGYCVGTGGILVGNVGKILGVNEIVGGIMFGIL